MENSVNMKAARLIQASHQRQLSPHQLQRMVKTEVEKWRNWSQLTTECTRYWP